MSPGPHPWFKMMAVPLSASHLYQGSASSRFHGNRGSLPRGGTAELPWGCWLGWLHLSSGETLAPLLCITDSVLPSASLARMALSGGRALPATLPVLCSLNAGSENSPGSRPGEKSPSQNTELQLRGLLSEHKIGAKKDRCVFVCFVFCLLSF